jgi:hypothetical protein
MALYLDELPEAETYTPTSVGQKTTPGVATLDEVRDIEDTRPVSRDEFDLADLSFTAEEITELKAKGKIGWFEQFSRMKGAEKIPVLGMGAALYDAASMRRAFGRLQADDYKGDNELRAADIETARKAIRYHAEEQIRGSSFGAGFVEGVTALPGYAVEFALSALVGAPGGAAAGRLAIQAGAKQIASHAVRRAVVTGARWAGRATMGATIAQAPRIVAKTYENEAQLNLQVTDRGLQLTEQARSKPATSFLKAWGDTVIDQFTEEAGGIIFNPALKKLGAMKAMEPIMERLVDIYKKLPGNRSVSYLFTKAGWNGFIEEIGEEVLADQLRAVTSTNNPFADEAIRQEGRDPNALLDRMFAAIPDGDELAVMMGVLAVPGATKVGLSAGLNAWMDYRAKKEATGILKDEAVPETKALGKDVQWRDIVEEVAVEATQPMANVELSEAEMAAVKVARRSGEVSTREFKEADVQTKLELLIKGRTADLDRQRSEIETRMGNLEVDIANLNKIERPDVVILSGKQRELETLSKQLMSVHAQIADTIDVAAEDLKKMEGENIQLKGSSLEVLRKTARQVGERMERAKVEAVFRNNALSETERRTALIRYLQARLPGKENAAARDKYALRAAKGMSEKQLQKMFSEIEGIRETVMAKQLRQDAEKLVERMRSKIIEGKEKGVFGNATLQKMADELIAAVGRSKVEAEQAVAEAIRGIEMNISLGQSESEETEELRYKALVNHLVGGLEGRNASQLEDAIRFLTKELANLLTGRDVTRELKKAQRRALKAVFVSEINRNAAKEKTVWQRIKKTTATALQLAFGFSSLRLAQMVDALGDQNDNSALRKYLVNDLANISRRRAAVRMIMERAFREEMTRIYGIPLKNDGQYSKFIASRMSTKPSTDADTAPFIASFVNNRGEQVDMKVSRWETIYWAAVAYVRKGEVDPRAMEIFTNENQLGAIRQQVSREFPELAEADLDAAVASRAKEELRGNAIPSDVMARMVDQLTAKDWRMVEQTRRIFSSFWPLINPVYSRAMGIDLGQIEDYIPWIRKPGAQEQVEQTFKWAAMVESLQTPFPKSTHVRLKESSAPFSQIGLPEVMHGFTTEMSHWIATHDVLARMAWLVKDADLAMAVNRATGGVLDTREGWTKSEYMKWMEYHLKGIASQGRTDHGVNAPWLNWYRRMNARAQLAQPKQFPMQAVSALLAIGPIGHLKFAAGLASFLRDPQGAIKLLSQAPSLSYRYQNIMIEMREIADEVAKNKKNFALRTLPDHYIFFFTQVGDRSAIMLGGWTVFKAKYDETKDIGRAYEAFDEFVFTLQQSSEREQLPVLVTAGGWKQLFQFLSGPAQTSQYVYKVMGEAAKNPSNENIARAARTFVLMFGYLPAARFAVSTAMLPPSDDDEDEDKWKKRLVAEMMQGPFSGLYALGHAVNLLAGLITGEQGFPIESSTLDAMDKTKKALVTAVRKVIDGEDEGYDEEEIYKAISKATKKTLGLTGGVPSEIIDSIEGLYKYSSGDWAAADIPGLFYGHSIELMELQRGY